VRSETRVRAEVREDGTVVYVPDHDGVHVVRFHPERSDAAGMDLLPLDLRTAARQAAEAWSVTLGEPLSGGTQGAVFAATTCAGKDVVVKAGPAAQIELERWWLLAVRGLTVELLGDLQPAGHEGVHVLLLERAGTVQPWPVDPVRFRTTALRVLETAQGCDSSWPVLGRFPAAASMVDLRRGWVRAPVDARRCPDLGLDARKWATYVDQLAAEARDAASGGMLLHGDAQAKNLVLRGAAWALIDPMPCVGAVEFDLALLAVTGSGPWPVREAVATAQALPGVDPDRLSTLVRFVALAEAVNGGEHGQPARLHSFLDELGLLREIRAR